MNNDELMNHLLLASELVKKEGSQIPPECIDIEHFIKQLTKSRDDEIVALREKLGVAVEALDYYSKRTPNRRACEALSKIRGGK